MEKRHPPIGGEIDGGAGPEPIPSTSAAAAASVAGTSGTSGGGGGGAGGGGSGGGTSVAEPMMRGEPVPIPSTRLVPDPIPPDGIVQMFKVTWPFGAPTKQTLRFYAPREAVDIHAIGNDEYEILPLHSEILGKNSIVFKEFFEPRLAARNRAPIPLKCDIIDGPAKLLFLILNYIYIGETEVPQHYMSIFNRYSHAYRIRGFLNGEAPAKITPLGFLKADDVEMKPLWF